MQAQSRNESMAIHLISIDRRLTKFSFHNFFAERDLENYYIIELMVTSKIFAQHEKLAYGFSEHHQDSRHDH